ncbi:MAG: 2-hydroxyacyl-CoA dehydratase, partial [Proteobacteria bacterium]|nr:2-hydroxyacyl-CoA dehydratase [Pseudomonadota bacterium]
MSTEFIKPFRAQKQMKTLMAEHFREVDEASRDPDQKVAWCTSVG